MAARTEAWKALKAGGLVYSEHLTLLGLLLRYRDAWQADGSELSKMAREIR